MSQEAKAILRRERGGRKGNEEDKNRSSLSPARSRKGTRKKHPTFQLIVARTKRNSVRLEQAQNQLRGRKKKIITRDRKELKGGWDGQSPVGKKKTTTDRESSG